LDPIGTISLNKKGVSYVAKKIARTTMIILTAMFALAPVVAAGGPHGHKKHAKLAKIKNVQLARAPTTSSRMWTKVSYRLNLSSAPRVRLRRLTSRSAIAAQACSFPSMPGKGLFF